MFPALTRNVFEEQDFRFACPMQEIATHILRKPSGRLLRHIMITGAGRKVGTSFVARNLTVSLCSAKNRVLLIQVLPEDSCQPTQAHPWTIPDLEAPGQPAILRLGGAEFLTLVARPARTFDELSERLTEHFDMLIWDAPPPGIVSATVVAAELMDGVVLVVDTGRTNRRALAYAADRLRGNGGKMLGVVMNHRRGRSG